MTFLVERLAELRQQLDHLRQIRTRVTDKATLQRDLSLHNDVLFGLLVICQAVIDIAGELAAREGIKYTDYTEAVQSLGNIEQFDSDLVTNLALLPGFRNTLVHEYVALDYDRVMAVLSNLEPINEFVRIVGTIESRE